MLMMMVVTTFVLKRVSRSQASMGMAGVLAGNEIRMRHF